MPKKRRHHITKCPMLDLVPWCPVPYILYSTVVYSVSSEHSHEHSSVKATRPACVLTGTRTVLVRSYPADGCYCTDMLSVQYLHYSTSTSRAIANCKDYTGLQVILIRIFWMARAAALQYCTLQYSYDIVQYSTGTGTVPVP